MRKHLFKPVAATSREFSGKPATIEAIRAAEAQIGVRFPQGYVELLLQQDGGYVYYNAYECDQNL
jgi:cell wall assembly regulator SMI1